ncbi:unnamed protein product [Vitrella brassicaformis CCMP3155]|uniref:Uncharacterized protein n=1 Tax=Vitrella brassicaformis (strain CCMP3155) TaxID=1169540 RepID=A0A0G4FJB2_VITBC|nr:unnamed protein product [Vitrella brassicaformis CCMP3155]|eukprot:CEM13684.1 unnamed protein product [Vitrella brassicaformis CCMP3155]
MSPFRLSSRQSSAVATGASVALRAIDAHTDVTSHPRKQREADMTANRDTAAIRVPEKASDGNVTASAAGRRKGPSPPETANGAAGAGGVGVGRGPGGEYDDTAMMIGPGVGIRTGGGRDAPRPLHSPAPQDGPKTLTLTTNHSGYMNEEMELVDAVERVVYRYALVAIQFLDSSEAMEAALRRSRHVSFHQSPSSPPLDANGASSATMHSMLLCGSLNR